MSLGRWCKSILDRILKCEFILKMMVLKKFKIERRSKIINFPIIAIGSAIKHVNDNLSNFQTQ